MIKRSRLILLVLLLSVVSLPRIAHAGCEDYWDVGSAMCTGAGGCQGEHEIIRCTFGCISGTCVNQGGSGVCCGKIYYNATIYPDGGDCRERCPGIRSFPTSAAKPSHQHGPLGYSPGLVMVTERLSYKPPTIVFVLDHCSHSFGVVQQTAALIDRGM